MAGESVAEIESGLEGLGQGGQPSGSSEAASAGADWLDDSFLQEGLGDDEGNNAGEGEGDDEGVDPALEGGEPPAIDPVVPEEGEEGGQLPAAAPAAAAPAAKEEEGELPVQLTPEQIAEQREQYLSNVASTFELSEEDRVELVTAPEKVLPRLAAQVQLRTLESVAQLLPAVIESQVNQMVQRQTRVMEGVQAFFGEWPELQEHASDVAQALTVLKQTQPNLTREQLIEKAGAFVASSKGLTLVPKSKRQPAPKQPAGPQGKRPAPPPGAGGKGTGSGQPAPAKPTNVFQELMGDD